jgi:hypothetical protein
MSRIFHPLMSLLACATRQELARQVQCLKVENEILRSKLPRKLTVTSDERRRLVRVGRKLGTAIKGLITIVSPRTFAQWVRNDLYVLVCINVGSRRVWISPPTAHPNSAWVAQQARNVCMHFQDEGQTPSYVMRDADTKYTRQFDGILQGEGIKVKRHTPVSPNLNAYVERFIQSIQQECLDHFIVCGERHFEYLVREYVEHYHGEV